MAEVPAAVAGGVPLIPVISVFVVTLPLVITPSALVTFIHEGNLLIGNLQVTVSVNE